MLGLRWGLWFFTQKSFTNNPRILRLQFVQVRDGVDQTAPFIGRFCGSQTPSQVVSSGKTIWVRFYSDSTTVREGFTARVQAVETPCGQLSRQIVNVTSYTDALVLKNPSYPTPYPSSIHCRWRITSTEEASSLEFHFADLDLTQTQRW